MLKNKKLLAIVIIFTIIFVVVILNKFKQISDNGEDLNSLVDSQSGEISQLKTTVEEHESKIEDLESKVENLESER